MGKRARKRKKHTHALLRRAVRSAMEVAAEEAASKARAAAAVVVKREVAMAAFSARLKDEAAVIASAKKAEQARVLAAEARRSLLVSCQRRVLRQWSEDIDRRRPPKPLASAALKVLAACLDSYAVPGVAEQLALLDRCTQELLLLHASACDSLTDDALQLFDGFIAEHVVLSGSALSPEAVVQLLVPRVKETAVPASWESMKSSLTLSGLSRVRRLDLWGFHSLLTEHDMSAIFEAQPLLQQLTLAQCLGSRSGPLSLVAASRLRHLTSVVLCRCAWAAAAAELIATLPALRRLTVIDCDWKLHTVLQLSALRPDVDLVVPAVRAR